MATSGVNHKFEPDLEKFFMTVEEFRGNLSAVAKKFNISRNCVHDFCERTDGIWDFVNAVRQRNEYEDLDMAESVYRICMSKVNEKPGIALRAAKDILDCKGKVRGWKAPPKTETTADLIDEIDEGIKICYKELRKHENSTIS